MHIASTGHRVIFEPGARAWDVPVSVAGVEFRRKVRTLTGNYQLLSLAPWLLTPSNPLLWRLVSHKLLRLVVPFAFVAALISSALAGGPFYRGVFILQAILILIGLVDVAGFRIPLLKRFSSAISALLVLNTAAVVALGNVLSGKMDVWGPRDAA